MAERDGNREEERSRSLGHFPGLKLRAGQQRLLGRLTHMGLKETWKAAHAERMW